MPWWGSLEAKHFFDMKILGYDISNNMHMRYYVSLSRQMNKDIQANHNILLWTCAVSPSFGFAAANKFCHRVSKFLLDMGTILMGLKQLIFNRAQVLVERKTVTMKKWSSGIQIMRRIRQVICIRHIVIPISIPGLQLLRFVLARSQFLLLSQWNTPPISFAYVCRSACQPVFTWWNTGLNMP